MQKKVLGIVAGVAAAHAVLLIGLMAGGGCRQPEILGPHTYDNGPAFPDNAVDSGKGDERKPTDIKKPDQVPPVPVKPVEVKPVEVKPVPVKPAPVKPAPVKPAPAAEGGVYKVKKGDTLGGIAIRHGVKVKDLADFNNIPKEKYNKIKVGQELRIPAGGKKVATKVNNPNPTQTAAAGVYVVKSGDTLGGIAARHGVKVKALADHNNIPKEKYGKLKIGQKLAIPGKSAPVQNNDTPEKTTAEEGEAPAVDDSSEDSAPEVEEVDGDMDSLLVSEDTTVEAYCSRVGITVEVFNKYNPNLAPDGKLKKGVYVKMPAAQ